VTVALHHFLKQYLTGNASDMPATPKTTYHHCPGCTCMQSRLPSLITILTILALLVAIVFGVWTPIQWHQANKANLLQGQFSIINTCIANKVRSMEKTSRSGNDAYEFIRNGENSHSVRQQWLLLRQYSKVSRHMDVRTSYP
jgi:hypothetical protein